MRYKIRLNNETFGLIRNIKILYHNPIKNGYDFNILKILSFPILMIIFLILDTLMFPILLLHSINIDKKTQYDYLIEDLKKVMVNIK